MELRLGVLTVSDRVAAGEVHDAGGPAAEASLPQPDWRVLKRAIVPDEHEQIAEVLRAWCDQDHLDVVFTTGGTGLGPRDVTPEATAQVCDRPVPGIAEALRSAGMSATPHAMLSRGVAGLRGTTLIVTLPGSPRGAVEGVTVVAPVLEHAVAIARGGRH